MDNITKNTIEDWYYNNFGNWEINSFPSWNKEILLDRCTKKVITLHGKKITWESINTTKSDEKYKDTFIKLVSIPTKEEVAYAIHGKIKSDMKDNWDSELQCKQNPAGIINIDEEINKRNNLKYIKYITGSVIFITSLVTIGYIFLL